MAVVSTRFRAARRAKGLTQQELAKRSGIEQSHISHVERGSRGLSPELLRKAADALGVTMEYLTGTDVGDRTGNYGAQPEPAGDTRQEIMGSYAAPAGLRELAMDQSLVQALNVREDEWHALSSVVLPGEATKDGYVQLLYTIRAISRA